MVVSLVGTFGIAEEWWSVGKVAAAFPLKVTAGAETEFVTPSLITAWSFSSSLLDEVGRLAGTQA